MSSATLETLIELAREARNKAGQLLAGERDSERQLLSQYELLQRYRREYAEQLQLRMDEGIGLAALDDYQRFLASLDSAIARARDSLQSQQDRIIHCQQQWQHRQHRLSSFDTLASRRAAEQRAEAERRERRLQDENTTTLFLRKQAQAADSQEIL